MSSDQPDRERQQKISLRPNAVALTIAGSDPSGGAGLQADLKTFQQLGVYGMSVVTLITVQNTQGVTRVELLPTDLVRAQLDAVLDDIPPGVVKTGALGSAAMVRVVAERLAEEEVALVVDPVLVSKHGHSLVTDDVVEAFRKDLLPEAMLVTPNRFEAERLVGYSLSDDDAVARAIHDLRAMGAESVLLKLGEVEGNALVVLSGETENTYFDTPWLRTGNTHGSGCVLSAAIAARIAMGGCTLFEAVNFGIERAHQAIACNTRLGKGIHPVETRGMLGE